VRHKLDIVNYQLYKMKQLDAAAGTFVSPPIATTPRPQDLQQSFPIAPTIASQHGNTEEVINAKADEVDTLEEQVGPVEDGSDETVLPTESNTRHRRQDGEVKEASFKDSGYFSDSPTPKKRRSTEEDDEQRPAKRQKTFVESSIRPTAQPVLLTRADVPIPSIENGGNAVNINSSKTGSTMPHISVSSTPGGSPPQSAGSESTCPKGDTDSEAEENVSASNGVESSIDVAIISTDRTDEVSASTSRAPETSRATSSKARVPKRFFSSTKSVIFPLHFLNAMFAVRTEGLDQLREGTK
jgi:hypothetical protein